MHLKSWYQFTFLFFSKVSALSARRNINNETSINFFCTRYKFIYDVIFLNASPKYSITSVAIMLSKDCVSSAISAAVPCK